MTEVIPSINVTSPARRARRNSESRSSDTPFPVLGAPPAPAQSINPPVQEEIVRPTDHSHSSVVPSYPYNVVMLPQSHNGPTPDDSGITTRLPSICVDYLSHDWAEDDVWTSWKAMTRHKSEIANGVRLENASWRTWAKQRGKLKTISPETLNWLKDSDVTWLYGPLHTAVEAVPPPKIATASDRLGLEPLRSLSDSKKMRRPAVVTKPILKYRSLSDILLPQGNSPASPILEATDREYDPLSAVTYAKSDSNLARLNREANRKRSASPHIPRGSPGSSSEEPALSDSSSTSGATTRNGERRHISFNHRVEQCISVDSLDETSVHPANDSSGSEDGDDEEEVLTFRSSARVAAVAAQVAAALRRRVSVDNKEPLTISRLGPTTLKSLEQYPSPSPAVVYQNRLEDDHSIAQSNYGQPVETYTSRPTTTAQSPDGISGPTERVVYEYDPLDSVGSNQSQWDEDEDYAAGFDYFNGAEVGVGDEYDMAQYGSTHTVGGSHNNYISGNPQYGPFPGPGTYSPDAMGTESSSGSNSPLGDSTSSSPAHSRLSSNQDASLSPVGRGMHTPPTSSKDSLVPKRSILKNRSRQNSDNSDDAHIANLRAGNGSYSPSLISPDHSVPPSPTSSSPQSSSPWNSSSSLATVMATAGIPSVVHLRDSGNGVRRVDSTELVREARGRSTSRGSSSSLERSASADRRTGSSSSISPSSSYSPPSSLIPPTTATSLPRPPAGSRTRSSDSLNSLAGAMAGRELMPGLPEASSESEAETFQIGEEEEESARKKQRVVVSVDEIEESIMDEGFSADIVMAEVIDPTSASATTTPSTTPTLPASIATPSSIPGSSPRYRQPSPGAPTTSSSIASIEKEEAHREIGSPVISIEDVDSTSSSAILNSNSDDNNSNNDLAATSAPSYARRSLLRASRGGGNHTSASSEREGSIGGRSSIESGRGGSSNQHPSGSETVDDSYGFGYYDEDSDGGIVSRTTEVVAGTVRDLLGALSRGFWRRDETTNRR